MIPHGKIAFVEDPRDTATSRCQGMKTAGTVAVQISIREPEDRQGSYIGAGHGAKKRPREIHGAISIVTHPAYVQGWNCKMNSRLRELPINRRSGNSLLDRELHTPRPFYVGIRNIRPRHFFSPPWCYVVRVFLTAARQKIRTTPLFVSTGCDWDSVLQLNILTTANTFSEIITCKYY